ncbi:MAG: hypothetical protein Q8T13_21725 [Acidobacteriota bacterium]|nr:hypothetical protein [Acidobacteriota bacterium]
MKRSFNDGSLQLKTFPDTPLVRLRGALFPRIEFGFDASTNGLLLATPVRAGQGADSPRRILTNGKRQPNELAAQLGRYELKGAEPRRAHQWLIDWH